MWRIIFTYVVALFFWPVAQAQENDVVCFGVEDCVQAFKTRKPKPYSKDIDVFKEYFALHPKEAQQALIPLIRGKDEDIARSAIRILRDLEDIDPIYTSDLIEADQYEYSGLKQLIAKTQSQEALDYLWRDFLDDPVQDVDHFSYFEKRMGPLIEDAKRSCTQRQRLHLCKGVADLIETVQNDAKTAQDYIVNLATTDAIPIKLKLEAQFQLMAEGHELAATFYQSVINWLLADFHGPRNWADHYNGHEWVYDYDLSFVVQLMQENAYETQQIGPILAPILKYPELKKTRRAVAQAIVETKYRPGAKALLDYQDIFEEDWAFAYHAIEAFGQLDIKEAKPLLKYHRDNHWYNPVRRQAERALNALNGSEFEIKADRIREEKEKREREKAWAEDDEIIVTTSRGPVTPVKVDDVFESCETTKTLPYIKGLYLPPVPDQIEEIIALENFPILDIYEFNDIVLDAIGNKDTNDPYFLLEIDGQMMFSDGLDDNSGKKGGLYIFDGKKLSKKLIEGSFKLAFPSPNLLILISDEIDYDAVHIYERKDNELIFKREIFLPYTWNRSFFGPDNSLILSTRFGDLGIDKHGNPFDPVVEGICAGPNEVD